MATSGRSVLGQPFAFLSFRLLASSLSHGSVPLTWYGGHHFADLQSICTCSNATGQSRPFPRPRGVRACMVRSFSSSRETHRGWWSFLHCRVPARGSSLRDRRTANTASTTKVPSRRSKRRWNCTHTRGPHPTRPRPISGMRRRGILARIQQILVGMCEPFFPTTAEDGGGAGSSSSAIGGRGMAGPAHPRWWRSERPILADPEREGA